MSGLALAGMISGAGQGAERGLINLQQGLIQLGLQNERDQLEQKRLNATLAHADSLEAARQRFATLQQADSLAATKQIHEGDRAAQAEQTDKNISANKDIADANRDAQTAQAENKYSIENRTLINSHLNTQRELEIKGAAQKSQQKLDESRSRYFDTFKDQHGKTFDPMKDLPVSVREKALARYKMATDELDPTMKQTLINQGDAIIDAFVAERSGKPNPGTGEPEIVPPYGDLKSRESGAPSQAQKSKADPVTAPTVRGSRVIPAQAQAGSVGPMDALRGGASAAGEGLINTIRPDFTPTPGIAIEKRKPKGD